MSAFELPMLSVNQFAHPAMNLRHAPSPQAGKWLRCIEAAVYRLRSRVAGLARQQRLTQQMQTLWMPHRTPLRSRGAGQNQAWHPGSRGDVHRPRVVADKKPCSCDHTDQMVQVLRLHPLNSRIKSYIAQHWLLNPSHRMLCAHSPSQLGETLHRPALILPARSRMDHDRIRVLSSKGAQIGSWHLQRQRRQQCPSDAPVVQGRSLLIQGRHAILQQPVQSHLLCQRPSSLLSAAKSRQNMGHAALVIPQQAHLRLLTSHRRHEPGQPHRASPRTVELRRFKTPHLDPRAARFMQPGRCFAGEKHHSHPLS